MRVVFFGTPEFAVPTLERLLAEPDFEVIGVVTQPDARRGRGNQVSPSPVKLVALSHNLTIWQPERLKKDADTLAALEACQADVFVVVAYGQILSQAILDLPRYGCINVHGSLLPKYRGAAPIQWAIANGEKVLGITTMQMDAGVDTGAMLLRASLEVAPSDHAEMIIPKLANIGADLLIQTLRKLEQIQAEPQDHALSTYAPMIKKEDWQLDWSKDAIALHNQIRAFYPNCYTNSNIDGKEQRLKITKTTVIESDSNGAAGAIAEIIKNVGFSVQTGSGLLRIDELQPAGKRLQTGWDFANGSRLKVGEVLNSTQVV
jgi:methionyl-tRNA formyltransferase